MNLDISIVIPTHNRSSTLQRTLRSLACQKTESYRIEVIVVDDGSRDNTEEAVRLVDIACPLRIIKQKQAGAAAARNRGAEAAMAPLILFIDDDMEATPQLVHAHVNAHRRHPDGIVIGYFTTPRQERSSDPVAVDISLWWDHRFSEMGKESHRFTFQDIFTGNLSLSRDLFFRIGKFDEQFHRMAGEDYEFGWRLLKNHVRFRFVPEAATFHHDFACVERSLRRAFAEGRGHILMAQKHPELACVLPLLNGLDGGPWIKIWRWIRLRRWMLTIIPKILKAPLGITRLLKFRRWWRRFHRFMRYCMYWKGIYVELGNDAELQRFMNEIPLIPSNFAEIELDLETDLEKLDETLDESKVDAVGLRYRETPIGWIPPITGAEPLRPAHVRHAIVHWWGYTFLKAKLRHHPDSTNQSMDAILKRLDLPSDPGVEIFSGSTSPDRM